VLFRSWEELRTGDVAVRGSQTYANWSAQLLGWEECEPLLAEFCAEAGLPSSAREFTESLRTNLVRQATAVDAGYPDNADLVLDPVAGPSLRRRKGKAPSASAVALEEALKERLPERTLLEILARTAYWLEWWRRFGPASGSNPKLADPLPRYVLTTFAVGCRSRTRARSSTPVMSVSQSWASTRLPELRFAEGHRGPPRPTGRPPLGSRPRSVSVAQPRWRCHRRSRPAPTQPLARARRATSKLNMSTTIVPYWPTLILRAGRRRRCPPPVPKGGFIAVSSHVLSGHGTKTTRRTDD
jgi:hypothetical protein